MMQAPAATPISGIPVLEIVPGDIPVTVLAEPAPARAREPRRSLDELIAARRQDAPTTMRTPVVYAPVIEQAIFGEEPTELSPQLLGAHRRTLWLAASTITAWVTVLVAAIVWMVTSALVPDRAEAFGASDRAPRVAAAKVSPKVAPAPKVTPPKVVTPVKPVAPAPVPTVVREPEVAEPIAPAVEAPVETPVPSDIEENPYTD